MTDLPKVTDLSPDQVRVMVAKEDGWTDLVSRHGTPWGTGQNEYFGPLPNYPKDLNAMASAVASLQIKDQHAYVIILSGFFWPMGWNSWTDTLAVSEATALQRARAFLVAKGRATL